MTNRFENRMKRDRKRQIMP